MIRPWWTATGGGAPVPFTGSHPAAVLPFLGSPLPASALVIGSLAPDVPYYLPWWPGPPTHTAVGVVTVDLALGAAGWALWHGVLSAPALATAPAGVRRRLAGRARTGLGARLGSPGSAVRVAAGVGGGGAPPPVLGAVSHPRPP